MIFTHRATGQRVDLIKQVSDGRNWDMHGNRFIRTTLHFRAGDVTQKLSREEFLRLYEHTPRTAG